MLEVKALVLFVTCLARCLMNEGASHSSVRQARTSARYDEGTLTANHNAATGERGCHNNIPINWVIKPQFKSQNAGSFSTVYYLE